MPESCCFGVVHSLKYFNSIENGSASTAKTAALTISIANGTFSYVDLLIVEHTDRQTDSTQLHLHVYCFSYLASRPMQ